MSTKNYDHMIYGSWDMVCNRWMVRKMEKVTYKGKCPTWQYLPTNKSLTLSLPSHMLLSHVVQQTKINNFKTLIDNIYSNAFSSSHNTWPSPPISYCSWHFLKSNIYIIKYTFFYTKSIFLPASIFLK